MRGRRCRGKVIKTRNGRKEGKTDKNTEERKERMWKGEVKEM